MVNRLLRSTLFLVFFLKGISTFAETIPAIVVWSEAGVPTADSASVPLQKLQTLLPSSPLASGAELPTLLSVSSTRLLVLPYGSAFPEEAWESIYQFLQRGGNLLVLGGQPFTRAAFRDAMGWHLRDYSVRFTRPLMIDQYQVTPGSDGLEFQSNPDLPPQVPAFRWKRAFSPVIRLSAVDVYKREGSAGSIDARLDALAWGIEKGRKVAAPAVQIDHLRNGFDGGRWIFVNSELMPDFWTSPQTAEFIRSLAEAALRGSEEFTVRPLLPLYLPGEPVQVNVQWHAAQPSSHAFKVKITEFSDAEPGERSVVTVIVPSSGPVSLPAPKSKGLHTIEAQLIQGDSGKDMIRAIYRSGFWIRDEAFLRSGPMLTVNRDYFELDGHPLAVVGTTYMSSEVQRLYFEHPNVYVWNRDLAQIQAAGLNMIRTGWWTGWDKFCDENGEPYERTLRTLEAYLMTARKNGLPVQFNLFAFLPEVLGGINPYLDPEIVRKQQTLIAAMVSRFHDVPFLAWDFVNEPSISEHVWTMHPNGDPIEVARWNQWLRQRYPNRAALATAWNLPVSSAEGTIPLPDEDEFAPRSAYQGHNSLKVYDYSMFAQQIFAEWVQTMAKTVRDAGSRQLVTVGQDEGGIQDRPSPAFWGEAVDFTTNHTWWQNEEILWDSLLAKQPGEAMLIQETGLQRELNLDEVARRTPENEAALLERKIATSFIEGSGAIEWLWNTNSYMTLSNETPIGAVRPDGTQKPEAAVMEKFAGFAKLLQQHLRNPQTPSIAVVTSQAAQFSVIGDMQVAAQRKAIRALAYYDRLAPYAIAENQIDKLGLPQLAILPSPQSLTDHAWEQLLKYVGAGGNLLITGPVDRDEHWHITMRAAQLKLGAETEPLTYHDAAIRLGDSTIPLSFDHQAENFIESLRFTDGSTFKEMSYGRGRIFWVAYPVELAEGTKPTADLYSYVASRAGIAPMFATSSPISPGVLIYPTVLEDSILYVMVSDSAEDLDIDLHDKLTGARFKLKLASQHAAMAIIGKQEKAVVAKYGF